MKALMIYGAGGHAKVITDIVVSQEKYRLLGFIDDQKKGNFLGFPIYTPEEFFKKFTVHDCKIIIAIGDSKMRKEKSELLRSKGFQFGVAIHPASIVAQDVKIGPGSVVIAGAVINPGTRIGKHCIINTRSSIDHDCDIGDYAHIAPGAVLGGGVKIGSSSWVGIGTLVRENRSVGQSSTIGMGSVVVKDVPDNVKVWGNPAKVH